MRKPLQTAESEALREAVRIHEGSQRELAAALGKSERTLYRKLRDLPCVGREGDVIIELDTPLNARDDAGGG